MRGKVFKDQPAVGMLLKLMTEILYHGTPKGIFKIDGLTSTNPTGWWVTMWEIMDDPIQRPLYRRYIPEKIISIANRLHIKCNNILLRPISTSYQPHLASLKEPKTSQGFIDRFLVTSEAYHIRSLIIINKARYLWKERDGKISKQWEENVSRLWL